MSCIAFVALPGHRIQDNYNLLHLFLKTHFLLLLARFNKIANQSVYVSFRWQMDKVW